MDTFSVELHCCPHNEGMVAKSREKWEELVHIGHDVLDTFIKIWACWFHLKCRTIIQS